MKKLLSFVCALLMAMAVNMSFSVTAEAARVAVLPLQFKDLNMERAGDFTTYYWDIMVNKFKYPDYEMMDDEKVAAAVPGEELKSFDKASLMEVAEKADADIVVVMRLDDVDEKDDYMNMNETMKRFRLEGEYAGYNRLTGTYYHKKIFEHYSVEADLAFKNDYQQMTFVDITKRYVYRTVKEKKK